MALSSFSSSSCVAGGVFAVEYSIVPVGVAVAADVCTV